MKYFVIEKETGEIIYKEINEIIENQSKYIFIEEEYTRSLTEIWDQYEKPFIARNNEGYYVVINKNPKEQKEKYNYNIYGKIDKSIIKIITKNKTQTIYDLGNWKFIAIYE